MSAPKGDIVAARINITPELQVAKTQLLDAILKEISHEALLIIILHIAAHAVIIHIVL